MASNNNDGFDGLVASRIDLLIDAQKIDELFAKLSAKRERITQLEMICEIDQQTIADLKNKLREYETHVDQQERNQIQAQGRNQQNHSASPNNNRLEQLSAKIEQVISSQYADQQNILDLMHSQEVDQQTISELKTKLGDCKIQLDLLGEKLVQESLGRNLQNNSIRQSLLTNVEQLGKTQKADKQKAEHMTITLQEKFYQLKASHENLKQTQEADQKKLEERIDEFTKNNDNNQMIEQTIMALQHEFSQLKTAHESDQQAISDLNNKLSTCMKQLNECEIAQKQMIGEKLYPRIARYHQEPYLGKITGMMLELDNAYLTMLLKNENLLQIKVAEAYSVLQDSGFP